MLVGLTPFHLNKNDKNHLDKNFPTKLKIFHIQTLIITLKIDATLKSFLAMQFFQLLFESNFPVQLSLLLNSSIR